MTNTLISSHMLAALARTADAVVAERAQVFLLARARHRDLLAEESADVVIDFVTRLMEHGAAHLEGRSLAPHLPRERDAAIAREVLRLVANWDPSQADAAETWQLAINLFLLDDPAPDERLAQAPPGG